MPVSAWNRVDLELDPRSKSTRDGHEVWASSVTTSPHSSPTKTLDKGPLRYNGAHQYTDRFIRTEDWTRELPRIQQHAIISTCFNSIPVLVIRCSCSCPSRSLPYLPRQLCRSLKARPSNRAQQRSDKTPLRSTSRSLLTPLTRDGDHLPTGFRSIRIRMSSEGEAPGERGSCPPRALATRPHRSSKQAHG